MLSELGVQLPVAGGKGVPVQDRQFAFPGWPTTKAAGAGWMVNVVL